MSEQSYIKSIFIKGFKKFREFDMEFYNGPLVKTTF